MRLRVVLAGALLAGCAAQREPTPDTAQAPTGEPPVVAFVRSQGAEVVRDFSGPSGLRGWVIRRADRTGIVYSTADGQTLISGLLSDAHGGNLSARDAELHTPPADLGALWQDLTASAWVQVGDNPAAPVVYLFADLNCPYCHQTWEWLQAERAHLTVRWVPVAILGGDSPARAAAVLDDADPPARLAQLMRDFRQPLTAPPDAAAVRAAQARLDANLELMARAGASGTPALVLRNASGVRVREGLNGAGDLRLLMATLVAGD